MIYRTFQNLSLSQFGMGTMRLPTLPDGSIDEAQTEAMIRLALENGLNYFDTAWPYHGGKSELVMGKILNKFPRESWYLADKFPGHQIMSSYDVKGIFEKQLEKCGVEYFDFYLLHNVCEMSMPTYTDARWDIVNYFVEQKKLGRIRHLGFSTHAGVEGLRKILDVMGEHMEFCQLQLNYLDWTLQEAKAKYELLTERGIPVWVMEPVRGGKLAVFDPESAEKLAAFRPEATAAEWALRWLQQLPNVTMILSGVSNMAQMQENLATFQHEKPLSAEENAALMDVAEGMKNGVPCTGCRYCVEGCPMGLDIPTLLTLSNENRYSYAMNIGIRVDAMGEGKGPSACIGCGQCTHMCPQKIDIPAELSHLADSLSKHTSWAEICRQREEAAKKLKG